MRGRVVAERLPVSEGEIIMFETGAAMIERTNGTSEFIRADEAETMMEYFSEDS